MCSRGIGTVAGALARPSLLLPYLFRDALSLFFVFTTTTSVANQTPHIQLTANSFNPIDVGQRFDCSCACSCLWRMSKASCFFLRSPPIVPIPTCPFRRRALGSPSAQRPFFFSSPLPMAHSSIVHTHSINLSIAHSHARANHQLPRQLALHTHTHQPNPSRSNPLVDRFLGDEQAGRERIGHGRTVADRCAGSCWSRGRRNGAD